MQIVEPVDLSQLLTQIPDCHAIMTTGELATTTLVSLLPPTTKTPRIGVTSTTQFNGRTLDLYRLPSSSRAYPLALEKKAKIYHAFFEALRMV